MLNVPWGVTRRTLNQTQAQAENKLVFVCGIRVQGNDLCTPVLGTGAEDSHKLSTPTVR